MESFLTTCHELTKKQQVMHDTIFDKLNEFQNILQTTKESLEEGKPFVSLIKDSYNT